MGPPGALENQSTAEVSLTCLPEALGCFDNQAKRVVDNGGSAVTSGVAGVGEMVRKEECDRRFR